MHCSTVGAASPKRHYTIVHNGRFHEVGCDRRDFKVAARATRRTHTHNPQKSSRRVALLCVVFCKSRPPGGGAEEILGRGLARGKDVLLLASQLGPEGARAAGKFAAASWVEQQELARSSMAKKRKTEAPSRTKAASGAPKGGAGKAAAVGAEPNTRRRTAARPAVRSAAAQAKAKMINSTIIPKKKANTINQQHGAPPTSTLAQRTPGVMGEIKANANDREAVEIPARTRSSASRLSAAAKAFSPASAISDQPPHDLSINRDSIAPGAMNDLSDEGDDDQGPAVTFDNRGHSVFYSQAEPPLGEKLVVDQPHEADERKGHDGLYEFSDGDGVRKDPASTRDIQGHTFHRAEPSLGDQALVGLPHETEELARGIGYKDRSAEEVGYTDRSGEEDDGVGVLP